MKTMHSDNIDAIVGNADRKQHCQMHSSYIAKRRAVKICNHRRKGRTPSERMKHICNNANTAAVYLVQSWVGSCRADTGN